MQFFIIKILLKKVWHVQSSIIKHWSQQRQQHTMKYLAKQHKQHNNGMWLNS